MDIGVLASSLTTALVPLLPYLLKAGEKAAEETGKAAANQSLEWGKSLWSKLKSKVEAKPDALEAAQDIAQSPEDQDAQAALRRHLRKLLTEGQSLAEEVSRWLEQGKAAGLTVTASGERSVAIGGNVKGSTIVTGDGKYGEVLIVTNRRTQKKTSRKDSRRGTAIGGDVSGSPIVTGGREREIDTLINALHRESRACITGISGMGGIDKTELALRVAERLRDDYPDAQFFINPQGPDTNPRSPQEAMAICVRAFVGPEVKLPEDPEQLSHLYRSQLSGKRVLLLLDNVADSAQVLPLLPPTGCWRWTNSASALKPSKTLNRHSPSTSRSKIPTPGKRAHDSPPGASKQTRETHFFTARERKPISLRPRGGVAINCRIASKTTLNCLSYLLSSSFNRRESSALEASICRNFTNARMISMLTNIARSLFRTLESIATPCSVKT